MQNTNGTTEQEGTMHVILPKTFPGGDLEELRDLPMFFLAGPILGAVDWQREMTLRLEQVVGDCITVNPRRYNDCHPLQRSRLSGNEEFFERQKLWERHFLRQAAEKWNTGCIIFWLPEESKDNPRSDENPYAMDTRGELGEWRGHMVHEKNLRVVIGAEPQFPGLDEIKCDFEAALGSPFIIQQTMDDTVGHASFFADPLLSFGARTSA